MKKFLLLFCMLVGVAFSASAKSSVVSSEISKLTISESNSALLSEEKPAVKPDASAAPMTCTVTMTGTIHAYGQDYQVTVTATASTCAAAGAAAGSAFDHLQSLY